MKRSFLANLVFLILLNLLIKPFWFLGIEVSVQNIVGNAEYGIYFSLLGLSLTLNILLDLGITNFTNREVARHQHLASKYLNNIILIKLYLGFFYAATMLVVSLFMGYTERHLKILFFLVINQFLASFLLYLRSYINGLHLFIADSLLSIADKLLMIIICGTIVWFIPGIGFKIEWFVYAQTVAYIIPIIVALGVLHNNLQSIKPRNDIRYFLTIAKESRLFAILVLVMFIYNRIDAVLLERILPNGNIEAGIYAQSYRLIDFASNYAFLFATLLLPIFSRMLKEKNDVSGIVQTSLKFLIVPTLIISIGGWFFKNEILHLLYNRTSGNGIELGLLFIGFVGVASNYIFGTLLTANGNIKELIFIALGVMVLNLFLNFNLIPTMKVTGAALSFLITQLVSASIQLYFAHRKIKIDIEKSFYSKCLILTSILFLCLYILKLTSLSTYYEIVIFISLSLLLTFVLKFINLSELKTLINKK